MKFKALIISILASCVALAQNPVPFNGIQNKKVNTYAIINATLHPSPGVSYKGNIVFKDEKIIAIGETEAVPKNAVVYDWQGKHIYPGFVEVWSDQGMPKLEKAKGKKDYFLRNDEGVKSWNMAIKPEENASENFKPDAKALEKLRKSGITTVCSHNQDGIMRGTGLVFSSADKALSNITLKTRAASFFSFKKGSSVQDYPSSLMGSIALIRQTYKDLDWYKRGGSKEYSDISLAALRETESLPKFFESSGWRDALRINKIGTETGNSYFILGAGDEYQRAELLKEAGCKVILPVNFPKGWDVKDAMDTDELSLSQMLHWEAAPANAAILYQKGVDFCFSASGLKDVESYLSQVKKAVKAGLSSQEAERALYLTPAEWLGISNEVGSLEIGKRANFIVLNDSIFEANSVIEGSWVLGDWYPNSSFSLTEIQGSYKTTVNNNNYQAEIIRKANDYQFTMNVSSSKVKGNIERTDDRFNLLMNSEGAFDKYRFNGNIISKGNEVSLRGVLTSNSGEQSEVLFTKIGDISPKEQKDTVEVFEINEFKPRYPFHAFGNEKLPETENLLLKNATVWTCAEDYKPQVVDIYIESGKILQIAEAIDESKLKGIKVLDLKGKHITPGIVDEHSHIAIERGVNEGTQNNTAEVRIGDVIYSEDPGIYYQLAGGVTSSQLLHGSANPIGGQSAIIKLKWGESPEAMKNANAPGHIKFALGENVKQSNWGDNKRTRFPQTRMGVEQVFYDAFVRAKEYALQKEASRSKKSKSVVKPFREDLELEAILEILDQTRFITCHSYIQSEVNMLMHVADSMGFKVNTFTHILEGYKLADKLKEHGANASTFSDWWAYKHEVSDAIPYNAAILNQVGVITGINSDDTEMGRRLNQEAAKSILYGGLSETEALKLITINPAKMLHIDEFTGSLEVGKDADIVVWSDHPLSIKAKVQMTFIEGKRYFDLEKHNLKIEEMDKERKRLIAKLLISPEAGKEKRPSKEKRHEYHCDDLYHGEFYEREVTQ